MAKKKFCPNCDSEVKTFDKYCSNCGTRLINPQEDNVIVKCARCNGKGKIYRSIGDWSSGGETCPACGGASVLRI